MKAIFDIGHPAHVHLFKNTISNLIEYGWEVKVAARPKETTIELLDAFDIEYQKLSHYNGIINKALGMIRIDFEYLNMARSFNPDIFISIGSPYSAHVSLLTRKPHISFADTPAKNKSLYYLASYAMLKGRNNLIATSDFFPMNFGPKKQIRYRGYHELAYLSPRYFKPDPSILQTLGLTDKSKYIIVRFASWDAVHDIGHRGFKNTKEKIDFVRQLADRLKVFITSEVVIPDLKKYEVPINPKNAHHLLAYATMYIGEGATMASEAGVLGVPWIFLYTKKLPYLDDQEKNYGLGFTVNDSTKAFQTASDWLNNPKLKQEWNKKRKKLLSEKIDVTSFMTNLIRETAKNNYKGKKS